MGKLKQLWENKGSTLDKIKKDNLLIVLLAGVLLLVINIPVKEENTQNYKDNEAENTLKTEEAVNNSYEEKLEAKLIDILKEVEGVGNVKVMITLKASKELIVEKDVPTESKEIIEEDGQGGTRTTIEEKVTQSTVYEEEETNGSRPYVIKEIEPEIEGVVVLAQGGNNPEIVKGITEAIQALFPVEVHKIKVMKMN